MGEVLVSETTDTQDDIDSKIMGILNPTIHHHDLLQSYVRVAAESVSNLKQFEESEDFDKVPSLGTCPDKEFIDNDDKESHINDDKKDRKNNKKQRESKSNKLSVESEVNIQKKKK
ncbi:uncharacterized protein LOC112212918 [Bombus impatiens]|uniref:Uncharacterized protein LOC112212918 n=1 Tax=Bombus impatiens TaxID=132113 RepID=A0A6P6FB92_BOMIM|nr:uncharacterized protein LOC112212918 [Bombus impatiens]